MRFFSFVLFVFLCCGMALGACVDVDSASAKEIQALKNVGPSIAKSIVDFRKAKKTEATKSGKKPWSFRNWKTLMSVKGVGPAICKANLDKVCFGTQTQKSCPK